MTGWRRPYETNRDIALGLVAACVGTVFGVVLTLLLIGDATAQLHIKVSDLAQPYAIAAALIVVGLYRHRVGVYHNDTGVFIDYLSYHRVVPWSSIVAIESSPLLTPPGRQTRVVILVTVQGSAILTPLMCLPLVIGGSRHAPSASLLGRNLSSSDYARALAILHRGLVAAHARALRDSP